MREGEEGTVLAYGTRVHVALAARARARQKRISFVTTDQVNEYDTNIQIAELNALNAALAAIRWKKLWDFYADQEGEHRRGLWAGTYGSAEKRGRVRVSSSPCRAPQPICNRGQCTDQRGSRMTRLHRTPA